MRAARGLSPSGPPPARWLRGCAQRLPDAAVPCDRRHPRPPWTDPGVLRLLRLRVGSGNAAALASLGRSRGGTLVTTPPVLASPALGGRLRGKVLLAVVGTNPVEPSLAVGRVSISGGGWKQFGRGWPHLESQEIRSPCGPGLGGLCCCHAGPRRAGARALGPAPHAEAVRPRIFLPRSGREAPLGAAPVPLHGLTRLWSLVCCSLRIPAPVVVDKASPLRFAC